MKKLDIRAKKNQLKNKIYIINKNSKAYSFFIAEYHLLEQDYYKNIIVPLEETHKKR